HSQDDASELRWRTAQKGRGRPPLGEIVTAENLGDLASVRRPAQKAQQGDQPAAWRCGLVHSGLEPLPPAATPCDAREWPSSMATGEPSQKMASIRSRREARTLTRRVRSRRR